MCHLHNAVALCVFCMWRLFFPSTFYDIFCTWYVSVLWCWKRRSQLFLVSWSSVCVLLNRSKTAFLSVCITVLKGRWSCPFVFLLVCFVYRNGATVKWTAKTKGKQTMVCDTSALACGNWGIHSVPMWIRDTGKLMHEYNMFLKSYNTTWQCHLDLKAVCRLLS